jgi:hypothetical protein
MKNKLEVGLIFFLLLFLVSINDPLIYIGGLIRRIPDLQTPQQYVCLANAIPEKSHVLFASNVDGTLNWNTYNFSFSRTMYYLVPRVLAYKESNNFDVSDYSWLITTHIDPPAIDQMARQYHLEVVQTCGTMTVLKSAGQAGGSQ